MGWHSFLTKTIVLLTISYRDELLRYLHHVEDQLLPIDPLDLSVFNDLEERVDGYALKGTDVSYLNCSGFEAAEYEIFASGWSKLVHVLSPDSVLKCPNLNGKTLQNCFHTNFGKSDWEIRCRLELLKGFVNEVKLLLKLRSSSNVIKILSYCIPRHPLEDMRKVNIVTEKGIPLDTLSLLQMPAQRRHDLFTAMLDFFTRYPALRFDDLRRQQLVLVDDQVKIVDFDSAYFHHGNNADYDKYYLTLVRKLHTEILMNYSMLTDQLPTTEESSFFTLT